MRATSSGWPAAAATPSGSTPPVLASTRGSSAWGPHVRKGVVPDRDQAADAVSDTLDELPARCPRGDPSPIANCTAARQPLLTCMLRLEAFAVVCRRSSASDGLVTA